MGRKKGELNYWIVPKRCSVYQTLAFLAVLEEYPSYGTWTAANQDNITTKMRINYGALEKSTVKNQSARTLKAMVAYMGFIYKEKGRLIITEAGKQFLDRHREKLINKGYFLLKPVSPLLSESEVWKQQMLKLQLTNPDQPKCERICLAPFRFTLRLVWDLRYLTKEEIAIFVLSASTDSALEETEKKIRNFRAQTYESVTRQVEEFKETNFGKIGLKKAPSARYFMSFCASTGLMEGAEMAVDDPAAGAGKKQKSITVLQLKEEYRREVQQILSEYPVDKMLLPEHDEKKIWRLFYGQAGIHYPNEMVIRNRTLYRIYVNVENCSSGDRKEQELILDGQEERKVYIFPQYQYKLYVFELTGGTSFVEFPVENTIPVIEITDEILSGDMQMTKEEICAEIRGLLTQKGMTPRMERHVELYGLLTGRKIRNDKTYRGAYLEYYLKMYFDSLKSLRVIDEVYASVQLNAYGIPTVRSGKPDFVLRVGNRRIVAEVTLLHPRKTKLGREMEVEINSAVRHVEEYRHQAGEDFDGTSEGLFVAAAINDQVEYEVKRLAKASNVQVRCMDLESFLQLLESRSCQK